MFSKFCKCIALNFVTDEGSIKNPFASLEVVFGVYTELPKCIVVFPQIAYLATLFSQKIQLQELS